MENERNELTITEEERTIAPYDNRCENTDESNSSGGLLETVIKFGLGVVTGIAGTIIAIKHKQKKEEERKKAEDEEVTASVTKMHCDGINKAKAQTSDEVVFDEELEYFEEQKESKKK